ncbi:MAG: SH3 domain-containing protein [Flavobacteriaceae bacterium]
MKAVFYITILFTLFSITANFGQRLHCPDDKCSFQPGDQVYLFGNDVKLRATPNTASKVLELLKIGEWVEIIEKTDFSWPYNGFDSPFYKVKYDDMTGYILGGLFSLQRKILNGIPYFFAYSKEGTTLFLNIRSIRAGTYMVNKVPLANANISIKTMGNLGLKDLDGILYIDYYAEACGMEGGGIYFFAHNNTLKKVAQLSQISDAGIFHRYEKFIFPDDKGGIPEKIRFKKEQKQYLDDKTRWTQTTIETRQLTWTQGQLIPDFREKMAN